MDALSLAKPGCSKNRFIESFAVCGLPIVADGDSFHPLISTSSLSDDLLPLERPYASAVLDCVPVRNHALVQQLLHLCLPDGVHFSTDRHKFDKDDVEFHSFVSTREDGAIVHGSALQFYERVHDPVIHKFIVDLHKSHFENMCQQKCQEVRSPRKHNGSLSHTLPRRGHRVVLAAAPVNQDSTSGEDTDVEKSISNPVFDPAKDKLYVTKTMCIVTTLPATTVAESLLRFLHNAIVLNRTPSDKLITPERLIEWLLMALPNPSPGYTLRIPDLNVHFRRPSADELPLCDYSVSEAIKLLTVEKFVKIFTCVLLEQQVLIASSSLHRLMLVCESLSSLLFPFQFQHVYVPIIPLSSEQFLEAPLPFLMGLQFTARHKMKHGKHKSLTELYPISANACFVNVDDQDATVRYPEDLNAIPSHKELVREIYSVLGMRATAKQRSAEWISKRMSRSLDEAGLDFLDCPQKLVENEISMENSTLLSKQTEEAEQACCQRTSERECDMKIRFIFLRRFLNWFRNYEVYIIGSYPDSDTFCHSRDSMANFDKIAFLSDQPQSHLTFLAAFLETQMFTTFIDMKILSQWERAHHNLQWFDAQLDKARTALGASSLMTPTVEENPMFLTDPEFVHIHDVKEEVVISLPSSNASSWGYPCGFFPHLDHSQMSLSSMTSPDLIASSFDQTDNSQLVVDPVTPETPVAPTADDGRSMRLESSAIELVRNELTPLAGDVSHAQVAQTNWKFVEQLLRETKSKVKRLSLQQIGVGEAILMGHSVAGIVEQNMLVASLADLIERIWLHGTSQKPDNSPFWAHVTAYITPDVSSMIGGERRSSSQRHVLPSSNSFGDVLRNQARPNPFLSYLHSLNATNSAARVIKAAAGKFDQLSPLSSPTTSLAEMGSGSPRHRGRSPQVGGETDVYLKYLPPLPTHLAYDLKNVLRMSEIKTDVGYARGFIRLAIERKLLYNHLQTLLSDVRLLRKMYKRYAFLRCEDEREQFLYHLLTLNAVECRCFTNTYAKAKMTYRVHIRGGRGGTSAAVWMCVAGSLGQTPVLGVTHSHFLFDHLNLGNLSTLRIGHDNAGISPRYFVDFVLVRNEVTGRTVIFRCSRWLGRGIDDDSIERLLVATDLNDLSPSGTDYVGGGRSSTLPRARSPSVKRRDREQQAAHTVAIQSPQQQLMECQRQLGEAVNNVVKYFYSSKVRSAVEETDLTQLLCGESGLISNLELAFNVGFRVRQNFLRVQAQYPWDYIERVSRCFADSIVSCVDNDQRILMLRHIDLVKRIGTVTSLGKEGRFHSYLLLTLRDHILYGLVPLMAVTSATVSFYEELSFLRSPQHLTFLARLLASLADCDFNLEQSLTWGIDI